MFFLVISLGDGGLVFIFLEARKSGSWHLTLCVIKLCSIMFTNSGVVDLGTSSAGPLVFKPGDQSGHAIAFLKNAPIF